MARLYANENFPLSVVEELRRLGHDVLTTLDAGKANQRILDEEVLAFAIQLRRAVLTLNRRHFLGLAKNRSDHAGMILCTYDSDSMRQAGAIHTAVAGRRRTRPAGESPGLKLLTQ
jgi:hypothetical protein